MPRRTLALGCLAAIAWACNSPSNPTPTTPYVVSIKLDGPTRFAPTSSPKFTVAATMSDKTTQDYTAKVQWLAYSTYGIGPISMNMSGAFTIRSTGEATIQTSFGVLRSTINVMVIPDGTYRLTGTVTEASMPLSGATISVVAGTGTGLTTVSDSQGNYRLYGVAGAVQLQASKPGYDPSINTITVASDNVLDFPNMSETGGPPVISGTYSLSIVAAGDCRTSTGTAPLDAPYRNRTYTATVTESGVNLQAMLSGANFLVQNGTGNQFSGRVSPGHVSFTLQDKGGYYYYYYYSVGQPQVIEQLEGNNVLSFWGTADGSLSTAGVTGSFAGNIVLYDNAAKRVIQSCISGRHLFTMTPLSSTRRKR